MRPQDIAILLKIICIGKESKGLVYLSSKLQISISEISESLNRSQIANLVSHDKKRVNRQNFLEFLEHGVKYVFPQQPGSLVRGIPTAHSHPFMNKEFNSENKYVWAYNNGSDLGLMIEPLYPKQVEAINEDPEYYKLLALIDVLRVGRVREIKYAMNELKRVINNE